jgi:hypothetical protein
MLRKTHWICFVQAAPEGDEPENEQIAELQAKVDGLEEKLGAKMDAIVEELQKLKKTS